MLLLCVQQTQRVQRVHDSARLLSSPPKTSVLVVGEALLQRHPAGLLVDLKDASEIGGLPSALVGKRVLDIAKLSHGGPIASFQSAALRLRS